MRIGLVVPGLVLALFLASPARAQLAMDVSKITCDQFVHAKVGPPRTLAAWLSGFYNGRQDNKIVDTQNFEANLTKLEAFCYQEKNFNLPVMQAIDQIIRTTK
ncbi:MAG TPA: HdeA/HdeB family chaperone [Xanthobacteraceae bacterium]|jgi:acid stress chaperone HdeB